MSADYLKLGWTGTEGITAPVLDDEPPLRWKSPPEGVSEGGTTLHKRMTTRRLCLLMSPYGTHEPFGTFFILIHAGRLQVVNPLFGLVAVVQQPR